MLVIRLSRTGRKKQPTYRIVVAEHSAPVQGKYHEILGFYNPGDNKKTEFNRERIDHWISVGAKPSDTVAGLLKYNGVEGMDKFMSPRTKQRAVKNPSEEPEAPAEEAPAEEAPAEEAPAEEAPAEEAPAEEAPAEEAPAEEAPAEEAPAEEAPEAADAPAGE